MKSITAFFNTYMKHILIIDGESGRSLTFSCVSEENVEKVKAIFSPPTLSDETKKQIADTISNARDLHQQKIGEYDEEDKLIGLRELNWRCRRCSCSTMGMSGWKGNTVAVKVECGFCDDAWVWSSEIFDVKACYTLMIQQKAEESAKKNYYKDQNKDLTIGLIDR